MNRSQLGVRHEVQHWHQRLVFVGARASPQTTGSFKLKNAFAVIREQYAPCFYNRYHGAVKQDYAQ